MHKLSLELTQAVGHDVGPLGLPLGDQVELRLDVRPHRGQHELRVDPPNALDERQSERRGLEASASDEAHVPVEERTAVGFGLWRLLGGRLRWHPAFFFSNF